MEKIFPTIIIILNIGAAGFYLIGDGDWRKVGYWLAAAALNYCVTW